MDDRTSEQEIKQMNNLTDQEIEKLQAELLQIEHADKFIERLKEIMKLKDFEFESTYRQTNAKRLFENKELTHKIAVCIQTLRSKQQNGTNNKIAQ